MFFVETVEWIQIPPALRTKERTIIEPMAEDPIRVDIIMNLNAIPSLATGTGINRFYYHFRVPHIYILF